VRQAGQLNHRVTFQRRSVGVDSHGQTLETWVDIPANPAVWASKRQPRSREYFADGQAQAVVDVEFEVRYREDLDASMSIVTGGVRYEIAGPPFDPSGKRVYLVIPALHGVRDGR
jgi:SPP1 family predicted phage head-tail adaptor